MLDFSHLPDDEPPSGKTLGDFKRLWARRDEYLYPSMQEYVREHVKNDRSYRNVRKWCERLVRIFYRKTGESYY